MTPWAFTAKGTMKKFNREGAEGAQRKGKERRRRRSLHPWLACLLLRGWGKRA
jgi:hypothetical protein